MTAADHQRHADAVATTLESQVGQTRRELDRTGLVRLVDVITSDWLCSARAEVDDHIGRHGRGEHSLIDVEQWECPAIAALATDARVESFLHSLTSLPAAPGFGGYRLRVLRILDGSGVDSPPFDWHYDANAVTMLVPIVIPDDDSGHVALFPDHRPHRRWAMLSAAERLIVHNNAYGRRLRHRFDNAPEVFTVRLRPGDAYLFRGYRSLHATLPWPANTLRVTLLLQYGHPYGPEGRVVQALRARRNQQRQRRTRRYPGHESRG
ncbi:hypothetical protein BVC93_02390 [Mycobacterium sp. MS1601]|uniref:hypothetical protein n=1 Tax=Mycobacterium sp. MS1601 TaxID=1936029 RepID=UPI00097904E9|nr:hypothetical protein [Mycobacterium sp. MS1601]AQA01474.1 hypothetical protein BVC93_02390 [Mycobacterium sp. MS1601]